MNILFHISSLRPGGAERQLAHLVKGLTARGVETHIATSYAGGLFWDELKDAGVGRIFSMDRKGKWDFSIIPKLASYARKNDIDMVQGFMPPSNSFAALAGRLAGIPVLMAIRTSNMTYDFGGRAYLKTDKWLGVWGTELIVCNSEAGAIYHRGLGYPGEKMRVIPNGVQFPEKYEFTAPFSRGGPFRIGVLARLDPMKDLPTMLQTLKILLDRGEQVILDIFGEGLQEYLAERKREAAALQIEDHVKWHGFVRDRWAVLDSVDILASSAIGEGMSNSLLEGMAAGRVIVTTDVGDARAMLASEAGSCGYLVPPQDPKALAEALLMALHKPEESIERARIGQQKARKEYSVDVMCERYFNLYRGVVDKSVLVQRESYKRPS